MAHLTTIEGVGPVYALRLEEAGIKSVESLLDKGASAAGRREIAANAGLDEQIVMRFVNHADLMRISGIGSEYSELLEAAGVDTVPELAQRNASNLASALAQVNKEKNLVRVVPGVRRVTRWIAQAKELPRAIEY